MIAWGGQVWASRGGCERKNKGKTSLPGHGHHGGGTTSHAAINTKGLQSLERQNPTCDHEDNKGVARRRGSNARSHVVRCLKWTNAIEFEQQRDVGVQGRGGRTQPFVEAGETSLEI